MEIITMGTNQNEAKGIRRIFSKFKNTKLAKKVGDDKLIITLVLVALGVGLCIVYRNTLYNILTSALSTLSTQINNLLSGTVSNGPSK
jgi:hypothetical protein